METLIFLLLINLNPHTRIHNYNYQQKEIHIMTDIFTASCTRTLHHEGVYANDLRDPGGETVYGISRRNWPKWEGWKHIDYLKSTKHVGTQFMIALKTDPRVKQAVQSFYKKYFWKPLKCDKLPFNVAQVLFDTGVNLGKAQAVRLLQRACNQRQVTGFTWLIPDGKIGPKTLRAVNAMQSGKLSRVFMGYRLKFYISLCEKKPVMYAFLKGWTSRTVSYM